MTIALTVLLIIATVYAQLQIGRFTAPGRVLLTRLVLVVVGAASGYVAARTVAGEDVSPLLALAMGFGVVHVPAALILLIKRAGGASRS